MKIGICDDSDNDRQRVFKWLRKNHKYILERDIAQFVSGEALLEHLRTKQIDILFLDQKMNGLDGLKTAEKIRASNKKMYIIILTEVYLQAEPCYDVEINAFIIKSNFNNRVDSIFKKALNECRSEQNDIYLAKTKNAVIPLPFDEIVVIESNFRYKNLYLSNGTKHTIIASMKELGETFLKKGFINPHRSFFVNKKFILAFDRNEIKVPLDIYIPIPKDRRKNSIDNMFDLESEV